ncbi:uncharacterized protein L969DRAFT_105952 [Mixia osmundae IAM 14324]|uniref:ATP synthase mitochondrial F1 complex assembly factor 2 n=1 Tax=Mixia osmundae (strain CBS 9802 / IAM 14324 / JCM 22182 / KY 12970) TaxID=764103 RepID=G7EB50_MIXOS|nr:uncharacterized protein L969DRAFT_105952 [Mixia osmundae IAM 14324]KEI36571.1 hypothetical protein L969DRAFT_105952 [Mixia osmundae IAM 14324]GAB00061.1 hypothetical protein E5Q_06763 [Mixia osmundae IAM 14324]
MTACCLCSMRAAQRLRAPATLKAPVATRSRGYATSAEKIRSLEAALDPTKEPSQSAKVERTFKRFWKDVRLDPRPDGHIAVLLDKRTLKTTSNVPLLLPRRNLAAALLIANEWDNQDKVLKPHSLPITSLASRAIDGMSTPEQRKEIGQGLLKYLDTDTICFHEEEPPALVDLQKRHWLPLITWVNATFGTDIAPFTTLMGTKQSARTVIVLAKRIESYDSFTLAAFERAVLASKSYCIALGLIEGVLSVNEASDCAHVEVNSQVERWGQVEDTHDVDHEDIRTRLGSAAMFLAAVPGP